MRASIQQKVKSIVRKRDGTSPATFILGNEMNTSRLRSVVGHDRGGGGSKITWS